MRNLKRIIALAATFALTLTSTAFAANYTDVADDSAYAQAIETLSKLNIFTGYEDMTFKPDEPITRAEFAALIARVQGFEGTAMTQTTTIFNDVPASHWASGYIAQATNQGIVNGYGDGNFGPDDNVKYEEAIKMIMSTLGYEPYAKQEGGYPTGYLTAATRYGVTKGVLNTTTGVPATRGTIAQLLDNAIDTALMGQAKWSNNGQVEYVIYDGVTQAYKTLMSEYLGVTKLKGKVIANSITELESYKAIDKSKDPEVMVEITNNYNTTNDDFPATDSSGYVGNRPFKVAGTDAEDYLGLAVILYAKENTSDDTYDIVSMVPEAGKNTKVEFSLDKFDSAETSAAGSPVSIKYMKNDSDRSATKITIQEDVKVIYNNVVSSDMTFDNLFNDGLIKKDGTLGGKVVAYDTDNRPGYDVIFVEVGATGVVDEVVNGKITFKNEVGMRSCSNFISNIVVDDSDDDVIVNITKDGKSISVNDLKEWDVLSIITNSDVSEVYNIEVLSGNNVIEGSVSSTTTSKTSATENAYRIGGNKYDVADGAYKCDNLKVGNAGLFYIDAYGKIVAFNKDATSTSTGKASYNYAYVLGVSPDEDNFGKGNVQFKLLTAKQGIAIWNASSSLKIQGPAQDKEVTYKIEEGNNAKTVADLVPVGTTIAYTMSGNNIKTITLPGYDEDGFQQVMNDSVEYKADNLRFGKKDVDENTIVLFVDPTDDDNSEVGTIADLVDNETYRDAYGFEDEANADSLALIVVTDYTNKFGASSSIAVVSDVYEAQNESDEDIYTIEFYMDGQFKTANTTSDAHDDISNITAGDVYKFKFNAAGDIKEAAAYVDFEDGVREKYNGSYAVVPDYTELGSYGYDEDIVVMPVREYKTSTKTITDPATGETYKLSNAKNVYVIDPAKNNMVSIGGVGDVEYDKDITADGVSRVEDKDKNILADSNVDGLLDYVVIRLYEDRVEEVVVVKAYDFGRLYTY